MAPPKLLVVNFPINLRCYVLLGCRVINVILAINIGDSAFFDIAALVRQFGGLRHHHAADGIDTLAPPQTKILATPLHTAVYFSLRYRRVGQRQGCGSDTLLGNKNVVN